MKNTSSNENINIAKIHLFEIFAGGIGFWGVPLSPSQQENIQAASIYNVFLDSFQSAAVHG